MAVTVHLEVHTIATRTGLWCDACQLPSVVEADLAFVSAQTLRLMASATESICTQHE